MPRAALEIGYRHIDTAEMYGNEREVGQGVRDTGLQRADVFITSKLNNGFHRPDDASTLVGSIVVGAVLGHRIYAGCADGFDSSQLSADRRAVLDTSTSPPHTEKVSDTLKFVPEGGAHVNSDRCIGTRCEPLSDSDDLGTA
jgi:hypothetical protein